MTQNDRQHDFPVVSCLLSKKQGRAEKKPAKQDPFHGSMSSVRGAKAQRETSFAVRTKRLEGAACPPRRLSVAANLRTYHFIPRPRDGLPSKTDAGPGTRELPTDQARIRAPQLGVRTGHSWP